VLPQLTPHQPQLRHHKPQTPPHRRPTGGHPGLRRTFVAHTHLLISVRPYGYEEYSVSDAAPQSPTPSCSTASNGDPAVAASQSTGVSGIPAVSAESRKPLATHDPGKVLLDLAVSVAVGGDCVADLALLREEPGVFGAVACDPTVSRLIATLAGDPPRSLAAINSARGACRATAWSRAGAHAPDHRADAAHPLIIDLDASLVGRVNWRRNRPPRPTREDLGFTRCSRSSTMAPGAPGNRCRSCSGREVLGPTPPPITSA